MSASARAAIQGACIGVVLAISFALGMAAENKHFEKEAVAKGHAEYYLDGNVAKWRWKELQ